MNAAQNDHASHLALDGIPSMYTTLGSIVTLLTIVACMVVLPKICNVCKHCCCYDLSKSDPITTSISESQPHNTSGVSE
jgi:hypothetical protein